MEIEIARLSFAWIAESVQKQWGRRHTRSGGQADSLGSKAHLDLTREDKKDVRVRHVPVGARTDLAGGERPLEPVDLRQANLLVACGGDGVGRRQRRTQRSGSRFRIGCVPYRAYNGDAGRSRGDDSFDRVRVDAADHKPGHAQPVASSANEVEPTCDGLRFRRRAEDGADAEVIRVASELVGDGRREADEPLVAYGALCLVE